MPAQVPYRHAIGQPHVARRLSSRDQKRIAHAYCSAGRVGWARPPSHASLPSALNWSARTHRALPKLVSRDYQWAARWTSGIDGASNTSVDDIREIRENVKFAPPHAKPYRVYIIDEVRICSPTQAFNACSRRWKSRLLHVVFIFATTEIHKIPATILSRYQHYNFRRIAKTEIIERLRHVAGQDGIALEDRSLAALARASEGSMRDGLSLPGSSRGLWRQVNCAHRSRSFAGRHSTGIGSILDSGDHFQDSAGALRTLSQLVEGGHSVHTALMWWSMCVICWSCPSRPRKNGPH